MTGSKIYGGLIILGLIFCLPSVAFSQEPQGFPGIFSGEFGSAVGWQRALSVLETAIQAAEDEDPPYYVPSTNELSIYPLYAESREENTRVSIPFLEDWLVEVVIDGQVSPLPRPIGVPINVPKVFAPAIEERNAAAPILLVDSFSDGFAALEEGKISSVLGSSIDALAFFNSLDASSLPYPPTTLRRIKGPAKIHLGGTSEAVYLLGLVNTFLRANPSDPLVEFSLPQGISWE